MAKLEEIIKTEMSRSDSRTFSRIHLFREGSFLRAYEQSAWLMSRYAAAELNPKRHKTKQTAVWLLGAQTTEDTLHNGRYPEAHLR